MRDVSSFINLENELVKRNKELIVLNAVSSAFISARDLGSIYDDLLERVMTVSDMNLGWLSAREDGRFELKSTRGLSRLLMEKLAAGEFDALLSEAGEKDEPLLVLEGDEIDAHEALKADGVTFMAVIPLKSGGEAVGVLSLASRMEVVFDFDLASLLSLIGNNLSLITEKILLFQKTQRLSVTDPLTGLYNVRHFYRMLDSEVARTNRYSEQFSLILFDIDNFKSINDTYGHQAGDEVLAMVAEILARSSRQTDIMARYGGEEFIAILPNTPKNEAFNLGMRIKGAVDERDYLNGKGIKVTLSGGVASFPDDAADAKALLYAADMAMYDAKAEGKDRICLYKKK
jgi:diguanylate cyclase (GGDEF)-like protein